MALVNIDAEAAAKMLADEAAAKLEPMLERIVSQALAKVTELLDGYELTVSFKKKV